MSTTGIATARNSFQSNNFIRIPQQRNLLFYCNSVMAVPATVVYFTAYDWLKYRMGYRENDTSTRYVPVLAGSTARSKYMYKNLLYDTLLIAF